MEIIFKALKIGSNSQAWELLTPLFPRILMLEWQDEHFSTAKGKLIKYEMSVFNFKSPFFQTLSPLHLGLFNLYGSSLQDFCNFYR